MDAIVCKRCGAITKEGYFIRAIQGMLCTPCKEKYDRLMEKFVRGLKLICKKEPIR